MIEREDRSYLIIPAGIGISKFVQYYNFCFTEPDSYSESYTLMPSACGTISLAFDGERIKIELWGASVHPCVLGAEPCRYKALVLIKLTHIGLYQLLRSDQSDFLDLRLPLETVDAKLYRELYQIFEEAESVSGMAESLEMLFCRKLEQPVISDAILNASASIMRSHGQILVGEVAKEVVYSERQLNRLFKSQIGMGMKNYLKLTRFNYVLREIQLSPCFFASLSQEAGYFDQAHLDKDFKKITGMSPKQYQQNMRDFYYEGSELIEKMLYEKSL